MAILPNNSSFQVSFKSAEAVEKKSLYNQNRGENYTILDIIETVNGYNNPDNPNLNEDTVSNIYYVKYATTGALSSCVYDNGTGGVGATLTGSANGRLGQTNSIGLVDGMVATVGDIVLVKNQSSQLQNGLYEVTQLGSPSAEFILTRVADYDEDTEIYPSLVFVAEGLSNANKYFKQSTASPVIGTSSLVYAAASVPSTTQSTLLVDTVAESALPACTYTDGTVYPTTLPGYGAKLTANANGALGTIGGVAMTSGKRLIVTAQVNQAHNGVYYVSNAGSATQPWVLTRLISDSSLWYRGREYAVTNPSSTVYGSRYSVSSPLTALNSQYGTVNIVFSKTSLADKNFASDDLTFTANRTHDLGTYSVTFDGKVRTIAQGALVTDDVFAVRDSTDTSDLIVLRGNGRFDIYGDLYVRNTSLFTDSIKSRSFVSCRIEPISAIDYYSRGEIGIAYTNHRFDTDTTLTTAGAKIVHFANGGTVRMDIDKDGKVGMYNLPTSSVGLSAGQLWNDAGTLKIV